MRTAFKTHLRIAAVLTCAFGLGGCIPLWKTTRPSAKILVTDTAGAPMSGATVFLTTVRLPFGRPMFQEFVTGADGKVRIKGKRKWEVDVFLPDGTSQYVWNLCVSKSGFRPVPIMDPKFNRPVQVALLASPDAAECSWSVASAAWPEIIEIKPGRWIEVADGAWQLNRETMDDIVKGIQTSAETHARSIGVELHPWQDYLFQFQARMSQTSRYVYIKALCRIPPDIRLRKTFYEPNDGSCFFGLTYDAVRDRFDSFEMSAAETAAR